jgi:hypothetical protein
MGGGLPAVSRENNNPQKQFRINKRSEITQKIRLDRSTSAKREKFELLDEEKEYIRRNNQLNSTKNNQTNQTLLLDQFIQSIKDPPNMESLIPYDQAIPQVKMIHETSELQDSMIPESIVVSNVDLQPLQSHGFSLHQQD